MARPVEYKNAIRAGSRMSFVCAAWGEPSPVSITWYNTTGDVLQTQAEDINIYEEDVTVDGFTYKISILELCNTKDEHEGSVTWQQALTRATQTENLLYKTNPPKYIYRLLVF